MLVHRGVYRAGHSGPSRLAAYMAAVLACGPGALLRGRAAAHLHRLLRRGPASPEVLTRSERRIPGVNATRCRAGIDPRDATRVRGIPVTTVPKNLVDLAPNLAEKDLARACHEAGVKYRTTPRQVANALGRHQTAPGGAKLRRILEGDERVVLSKLKSRFVELLAQAGMPLPQTNRPADGHYVDCRWPEHRLTVELDSFRFHNSRFAWERDRKRERAAYARGDQFRRFTWGDVFEIPAATLDELHDLLIPAGVKRP